MKSAHNGVNLFNACNLHRMVYGIDDSRMRTSGKNHQTLIFEIHDDGGVIFDGIPDLLALGLAMDNRPALFKIRGTGNFTQKRMVSSSRG